MATTTLTSKGQITLPKAVRERLSLKEGARLRVAVDRHGLVTLERELQPPVAGVCGLLRELAPERPVSLAEMRLAVRRRVLGKRPRGRR
jgi:AbrB family looped-hinge helix DNA binding protein